MVPSEGGWAVIGSAAFNRSSTPLTPLHVALTTRMRDVASIRTMPRRLSRPARQVWRSGKALASTGAERAKGREHPRAARTKRKPKSAGRVESSSFGDGICTQRCTMDGSSSKRRWLGYDRQRGPQPPRYLRIWTRRASLGEVVDRTKVDAG